jgi:hypothetical protein
VRPYYNGDSHSRYFALAKKRDRRYTGGPLLTPHYASSSNSSATRFRRKLGVVSLEANSASRYFKHQRLWITLQFYRERENSLHWRYIIANHRFPTASGKQPGRERPDGKKPERKTNGELGGWREGMRGRCRHSVKRDDREGEWYVSRIAWQADERTSLQ